MVTQKKNVKAIPLENVENVVTPSEVLEVAAPVKVQKNSSKKNKTIEPVSPPVEVIDSVEIRTPVEVSVPVEVAPVEVAPVEISAPKAKRGGKKVTKDAEVPINAESINVESINAEVNQLAGAKVNKKNKKNNKEVKDAKEDNEDKKATGKKNSPKKRSKKNDVNSLANVDGEVVTEANVDTVVDTTMLDATLDSRSRSFKVKLPQEEDFSGRFTGLTPYQAANKALSKYFRTNENVNISTDQVIFSIKESTRGSKRHEYTYNGTRIKLEQPITYTIKSINGEERIITKQYKNQLTKVKKGNNVVASVASVAA